jgi:hypothetical protein
VRASIHFNLRTHLWSVIDRRPKHRQVVIATERAAVIYGAVCKVSESSRQIVLQKHCRSVHARIWGEWTKGETVSPAGLRPLQYNPYRAGCFHVFESGNLIPIHSAPRVVFGADGHAYIDRPWGRD